MTAPASWRKQAKWAVVIGAPPEAAGQVDLPLAPRSRTRGWWMKVDTAGQPARRDYRVLASGHGRSWLELRPLTRRTHQLRVHLAALGSPIVGDPIYGRADPAAPAAPLQLHARSIALPLYPNPGRVEATAPVPPHTLGLLEGLGPEPPTGRPASRSHRGKHRRGCENAGCLKPDGCSKTALPC